MVKSRLIQKTLGLVSPVNHHRLCPITWQPLQVVSAVSHFNQHFLKKPQPWRSQRYFLTCQFLMYFCFLMIILNEKFLTGVKWCHRFQSCKSPPLVHQLALEEVSLSLSLSLSQVSMSLSEVFEESIFVGSMLGKCHTKAN